MGKCTNSAVIKLLIVFSPKNCIFQTCIFFQKAANKDMDVYAEVLKWQKEMQNNGVDEAQIILNSNLEQIARVRLI